MINFNGVEIFTVEEMHENVKRQQLEKVKNEIISITEQTLTEWDGTVSEVTVITMKDIVIVEYKDGTRYKEDRERFEAGKWTENVLTEMLKQYLDEKSKEKEEMEAWAEKYGHGWMYNDKKKNDNREWTTVERYGDICRVLKEDLRIKKCVTVSTEHEIVLMVELEDGRVEDAIRFYPDEIWISTYEIEGKTLKQARDVKEYKDRMYLRQL